MVVRPSLACDLQESNIVLAGDRLAHICNEGGENTVLTATFKRQRSMPQLHTAALRRARRAGVADRRLGRADALALRPGGKVKLGTYPGSVIVFNVDGNRILVGRTNTILEIVSRTGKAMATLKIPHVGGALLRGSRIASIASHRFVLSNLHGKALRSRPVVGDATLMEQRRRSRRLQPSGSGCISSVSATAATSRCGFKGQFGYASAKLSHGGLFYAYNVGGGSSKPGRAGFVSAAGVQAMLRG